MTCAGARAASGAAERAMELSRHSMGRQQLLPPAPFVSQTKPVPVPWGTRNSFMLNESCADLLRFVTFTWDRRGR